MGFELFPKDLIYLIASFLEQNSQDGINLSHINRHFYQTLTQKLKLQIADHITKWFIQEGHLPPVHYKLTPTWELIQKLSFKQTSNLWNKIKAYASSDAKNIAYKKNGMDINLYHQKMEKFTKAIQNYFTKILQQPFQINLNNKIILVNTNVKLDYQQLVTYIMNHDEFFGLEYFVILSCIQVFPGDDDFHKTCCLAGLELSKISFYLLEKVVKLEHLIRQKPIADTCINNFCVTLLKMMNVQLEPQQVELLQSFTNTILTTRYCIENKPNPIQKVDQTLQLRSFKYTLKPSVTLLYKALELILSNESLLKEYITMLTNSETNKAINTFFHLAKNPFLSPPSEAPVIRTDLQK